MYNKLVEAAFVESPNFRDELGTDPKRIIDYWIRILTLSSGSYPVDLTALYPIFRKWCHYKQLYYVPAPRQFRREMKSRFHHTVRSRSKVKVYLHTDVQGISVMCYPPKHGLKQHTYPRNVQEFVDYDYVHKLDGGAKAWLAQFTNEYYGNKFFPDPARNLHTDTAKRPRQCYDNNNSRGRDAYGILKCAGKLGYMQGPIGKQGLGREVSTLEEMLPADTENPEQRLLRLESPEHKAKMRNERRPLSRANRAKLRAMRLRNHYRKKKPPAK